MKGLIERFWVKVDKDADENCWQWLGAKNDKGYGQIWGKEQKLVYAHRLAYELEFGGIPNGLQIDHLCRNHSCVNPRHLDLVTNKENILRGISSQLMKERCSAISRCPRGHLYTEENTYVRYRSGYPCRHCRECARNGTRIWRESKRDKTLLCT